MCVIERPTIQINNPFDEEDFEDGLGIDDPFWDFLNDLVDIAQESTPSEFFGLNDSDDEDGEVCPCGLCEYHSIEEDVELDLENTEFFQLNEHNDQDDDVSVSDWPEIGTGDDDDDDDDVSISDWPEIGTGYEDDDDDDVSISDWPEIGTDDDVSVSDWPEIDTDEETTTCINSNDGDFDDGELDTHEWSDIDSEYDEEALRQNNDPSLWADYFSENEEMVEPWPQLDNENAGNVSSDESNDYFSAVDHEPNDYMYEDFSYLSEDEEVTRRRISNKRPSSSEDDDDDDYFECKKSKF